MHWLSRFFKRKTPSRKEDALRRIDAAAERFRLAAEALPAARARVFWDLAAISVALRGQVDAAPELITPCRRIIVFYLPKMSELALEWVRLSTADPFDRSMEDLSEFRGYLSILEQTVASCRSRRAEAVRQTLDAFALQLERLDG